jgi:single-strand DNA-binding protein
MASFNKVILIGNMCSDPELKQTQGGLSVSSFNIAVNRRFKGEGGQQECDFITVVTWRQSAEFVCRYFKKGNPILVCGQLQTRSWTDNNGQKRYATEVVADEVSFVATSEEKKSEPIVSIPPKKGNSPYMPSVYQSAPQMDEVPDDGQLPF